MNNDFNNASKNTFSLKKILSVFLGLIAVCFLLFIALAVYIGARDTKQEAARQKWEWQHYTGWRLEALGVDKDKAHGLFHDKKIGEYGRETICTTMNYPGYSTCPAQEYVVNGQLAPAPQFDFGFKPLTPPPGFKPVVNPCEGAQ